MIFESMTGFWAFLALIPFIIIYLRRPKSLDQTIPSLMFLMKNEHKTTRYTFFRRFFRNMLILIQLLILLAMIFALTSPMITVPWKATSTHTVIVLDASGSMQAKYGASTRFDAAISEAKQRLNGKVSIVLAENTPSVILRHGSRSDASALLSKLRPKATSTNLGAALLAASDLLENKKGTVVILSDFMATEGSDILVSMRELASKGNAIEQINLGSDAKNKGIIGMKIKRDTTTISIKNFMDEEQKVTATLKQEGTEIEKSVTLAPNSIESVSFPTMGSVSKIELSPKDDLPLDDEVFISAPEKNQLDVLLITNKKKSGIMAALQAMNDVRLNIVHPPVLTINSEGKKIEPYESDIIFVSDINNVGEKEGILPGTFKDIKSFVEEGKSVVLMVQEDSKDIDNQGLLPLQFNELVNEDSLVRIDQPNNQFTKNLDLNRVDKYYSLQEIDSDAVTPIASARKDNSTIIYLTSQGDGKVFYYGIFDERSDFKSSPSYPIFWNELLRFLAESQDIDGYNFVAGDIVALDEQQVKTPSGAALTASRLLLDEQGIYNFNGRNIAVNMLQPEESDIGKQETVFDDSDKFEMSKEQNQVDLNLEFYLLILALLIMIFEILYIKRRGDI